jgi:hypothetical protein
MSRFAVSVCFVMFTLFAAVPAVFAQEVSTRAEFLSFMKRSETATKGVPIRTTTTVETGEHANGPWKPYSSWVETRVLPDRSHVTYLTGPSVQAGLALESIRNGKDIFAKQQDGEWTRRPDKAEGWLVSPASEPGFRGPAVKYEMVNIVDDFIDVNSTVIRVVSFTKQDVESSDTTTLTYIYVFDDKGVLRKQESIAHNGRNWLRRRETYEYDKRIKIQAPVL